MTGKRGAPEPLSLSRWSRRKLEAGQQPAPAPATAASAAPAVSSTPPAAAPELPTGLPTKLQTELPSIDSLSFDSDFTAFLRPEVDERLKRAALKKLLRDPRFNVMDGLDTYIDDYTKADPIAPEVVQDLLRRGFSAVASTPVQAEKASSGSASATSTAVPATEALPAVAPTQSSPASESPPEEPAAPRSS